MKTYKKLIYTAVLATGVSLTACNKELNLKPYDQVEQSQALLTGKDVQAALVGAYSEMGARDLYGGRIFLEPDLMATQNIITWADTYQGMTQMVDQTIPNDNPFVTNLWLAAYSTINTANNVLSAVSKVDAADQPRVQGEAEFIRGTTYFDLVRLFGRSWNDGDPTVNLGVPIVLTPTTQIDASSDVARSTVAQVYQQAINDLKDAEAKLPQPPTPSNTYYYATKYSAAAMLARLYLQKGDYANAAAEATTVISSGKYQLNADYTSEFPYPAQVHVDNTLEDIFAMQVTAQQGVNGLNEFYASSEDAGRGRLTIKQNFINEFEPGDTRAFFYDDNYTAKFRNEYGNVHVIRLAEMYLIRAESNYRLGTTKGDTPQNDLDKIRIRADLAPKILPPYTGQANDPGLAIILTERRHELAFEGGFFFHDAKRLGQPIGTLPYNSPRLVFPIPLREINANPKLVQNPGY